MFHIFDYFIFVRVDPYDKRVVRYIQYATKQYVNLTYLLDNSSFNSGH